MENQIWVEEKIQKKKHLCPLTNQKKQIVQILVAWKHISC